MYDKATVQVSVNNGAYTVVASNNSGGIVLQDGASTWQLAEVDLTSLLSGLSTATLKVRVGFDSVDSIANAYAGFLIDDVQVVGSTPCTTDAQCDDGAYCNGAEKCVGGTCQAGTAINCDDGVACTADSCNESTDACVHTPNDTLCSDGNACNGAEVCSATTGCQAGTPLNCDDSNACTTDSCNPATGCVHTPVNCDDGNACTTDTCSAATGQCSHVALSCDDGNLCTTDSCNSATGCVHAPVNCDDGNACTTDSCSAATGTCGHVALNCDDGNVCTTDSCNAATGCAHANNTAACSDDGNPCTNDLCGGGVCTHPNNTAPCADDGSTCTSDICSGGICTHPSNGTCVSAFLESGGQVVMEAEHFSAKVGRASHTWDVTSNTSASGGQVMQANPNNGANINTGYTTGSPELDYPVRFLTTGTHYVWVRGLGPGSGDRTLHAGIDGTGPSSSDRMSGFSSSLSWKKSTLDGAVATINVTTAGVHTINLWMREDGFRVDKILLTTSSSYTPTGAGPAESPKVGTSCTTDANCNDGNPCTQDTCVSGYCQNTAVAAGTTCTDDGNPCTNDVCSSGACTHPNNTATCTDDGNPCTNDVCSNGACTHPNNTASCADDGNVCTNDVCSGGVCTHPNNTATCPDDGNPCTNDVCSGGVCTHPDNGSCGSSPCTNFCQNPVKFTGPNYQSGNLGTAATCHQTTASLGGGNCGNFAGVRSLYVNGTKMTCNSGNWSSLPAKVNGGYCVYTTAGDYSWAYFTTW
jgi:hypothetical protein